ncbi:MAG: hypothetical protein ACFCUL_09110 [Flavobacteriaceae bacterium]
MEENKHREYDAFVKRMVNEAGLEEPPSNFTDIILSKIEAVQKTNNVFVYKPLISTKIWWFLTAVILVFFGYVIYGDPEIETGFPYVLEMHKWAAFDLSALIPNIVLSNTFVYGCMALAFFIGIQVYLLDRRFARALKLG